MHCCWLDRPMHVRILYGEVGFYVKATTWTVRRRATVVASLMTPSPKTMLNSRGARSGSSTCSTATLSVVAKMAPSARQSCQASCFCDTVPVICSQAVPQAQCVNRCLSRHALCFLSMTTQPEGPVQPLKSASSHLTTGHALLAAICPYFPLQSETSSCLGAVQFQGAATCRGNVNRRERLLRV